MHDLQIYTYSISTLQGRCFIRMRQRSYDDAFKGTLVKEDVGTQIYTVRFPHRRFAWSLCSELLPWEGSEAGRNTAEEARA